MRDISSAGHLSVEVLEVAVTCLPTNPAMVKADLFFSPIVHPVLTEPVDINFKSLRSIQCLKYLLLCFQNRSVSREPPRSNCCSYKETS